MGEGEAQVIAEGHLKQMMMELDRIQEEVETKKFQLEKRILKQLHDTETSLQTVREDTHALQYNKHKEELMSLLHHIEEREKILDEEEEIIRCDRLEDISRNMP